MQNLFWLKIYFYVQVIHTEELMQVAHPVGHFYHRRVVELAYKDGSEVLVAHFLVEFNP
jgi:hypothetical protein